MEYFIHDLIPRPIQYQVETLCKMWKGVQKVTGSQILNSSKGSDKKNGDYGTKAGRKGLREMLHATFAGKHLRLQYQKIWGWEW